MGTDCLGYLVGYQPGSVSWTYPVHWWSSYPDKLYTGTDSIAGYNTIDSNNKLFKRLTMDIFTIVVIGLVGVVLGMYIASQISEHIDTRTRHKEFMNNLKNFDKKGDKI